jgi:hypothetical protein
LRQLLARTCRKAQHCHHRDESHAAILY